MPEEEEFFDMTDWLTPIGFKPGRAVVFNDQITFTVTDLLDSLCKSTQTNPKEVFVPVDADSSAPVVIDMARAIWVEDDRPTPTGEVIFNDNPDWYMEGQIQTTAARFRLYVVTCDGSQIDSGMLQFIGDENAADSIIRVVCID